MGTPVFQAIGTNGTGTTSTTPGFPTLAANDFLILVVGTRIANTAGTAYSPAPAIGTPAGSGWTEVTSGQTSGSSRQAIRVWRKIADGTESGSETISVTNGACTQAKIMAYRPSASSRTITVAASSTGADTTNGTGYSAASGSVASTASDMLVTVTSVSDNGTYSARSITQSGATLGTDVNRFSFVTATGDDSSLMGDEVPVTTGATAAVTYAVTSSLSVTGVTCALVLREVVNLGITAATETDTAVALVERKERALTPATETDSAQALTRAGGTLGGAIVTATETDTAVALTRQKSRALTPATETDTAVALVERKERALTPATETDTAVALTRQKSRTLTSSTETDTAVALSRVGSLGGAIIPATETDTAVALTRVKQRTLTPATETDTAVALVGQKLRAITPATEVDSAVALVRVKQRTLTPATEVDAAVALLRQKVRGLTTATETDTAVALAYSGGQLSPTVENPRARITMAESSARITMSIRRASLAAGSTAVITPNRAQAVIEE